MRVRIPQVSRVALCALIASSNLIAGPIRAAPDLELRMSVDVPVPAPGQPVQFTVTVSNVGSSPAAGVVVTDKLPAELAIPVGMAAFVSAGSYDPAAGTWSVGDLSPAGSALLVIPAVVSVPTQPPCSVNVATTSLAGDAQTANNRAVAAVRNSVSVRCVDLAVDGSGNVLLPCRKSRHLETSTRVSNAGPDVATNVLVDMSQSPALFPNLRFTGAGCTGTRCTIASLAPGETVTLPGLSDDFQNKEQQTLTFNYSVSSSETDYATSNNQVSASLLLLVFDTCKVDIGTVGPSACFIATAAYGSPLDSHVQSLRLFRDRYLTQSAPGLAFIRLYYRYSPPIADFIAPRPILRATVRLLLTPLVVVIEYPRAALAALLLAVLVLAQATVRRIAVR
jgi:uncharacterized repeat protein (TIGR01451 family)